MFHFLHNKKILQIIILLGVLLIFSMKFFSTPITFHYADTSTLIYVHFSSFLSHHILVARILLLFNIILQLILLYHFFIRNNFVEEKSLLPVIWYLFFISLCYNVNQITPALFTNLLIIILLTLNINYTGSNLRNNITFSGILIAINSFLDISSLWLLLFLISSILISRFSKPKDVFVMLIAFFIPYIYLLSYYFFGEYLLTYFESYQYITYFSLFSELSSFSMLHLISALMVFCAIIVSFIIIKSNFDNKLIILRKRVIVLSLLFLISLFMIIFSTMELHLSLYYLFVPVVIYFSILHSLKKKVLLNDALVLLITISLILLFV